MQAQDRSGAPEDVVRTARSWGEAITRIAVNVFAVMMAAAGFSLAAGLAHLLLRWQFMQA